MPRVQQCDERMLNGALHETVWQRRSTMNEMLAAQRHPVAKIVWVNLDLPMSTRLPIYYYYRFQNAFYSLL